MSKEVFVPVFSVKFCDAHQAPAEANMHAESEAYHVLTAVVGMGAVIAKIKLVCGCRLDYFGRTEGKPMTHDAVKLVR